MANPHNIKKYAVTGSPVLFSKSPAIYNYLFEKHGLNSHYSRLAADSHYEVAQLIKRIGLDGINITAPFKQSLLPYTDKIGHEAKSINAINTITNSYGHLAGYNTDAVGIAKSLKKYGVNPSGKKCLIIGAGGAARAAAYAMKLAGCRITITNRNADKGMEMADYFSVEFIWAGSIGQVPNNYDLVINTIPSNSDLLNNFDLHSEQHPGIILLDSNYYNDKLKAKVEQSGGLYIPGIAWLAAQAIGAFELFAGINYDGDKLGYDVVYDAVYKKLEAGTKINKPLALIGFMGSGKSTIGQRLAEKLNYEFTDLDSTVEKIAGKSINEIFRDEGQQGFRVIESRALNSAAGRENIIVACGGGIIERDENIELLKRHFTVVWLFADPEVCIRRIDIESKPMLSTAAVNRDPISLYNSRHNKYFLASDLIVNAKNNAENTAGEIVEKIYEEIKKSQDNIKS